MNYLVRAWETHADFEAGKPHPISLDIQASSEEDAEQIADEKIRALGVKCDVILAEESIANDPISP